MRIMAVHAGDLSLTDGHMNGTLQLGAFGFMAIGTGIHNICLASAVNSMTIDATDTFECVPTAAPVHAHATFMACHACIYNFVRTVVLGEISDKKRT